MNQEAKLKRVRAQAARLALRPASSCQQAAWARHRRQLTLPQRHSRSTCLSLFRGGRKGGGAASKPELRAYAFTKGGQRIWVMLTPDQNNHAISLPAGFRGSYDKFGNPASPATGATSIIINDPTYLILDCAYLYRV